MSGICGILNLDGKPIETQHLKRMTEAAPHRGPDGVFYWIEGNAGLAHQALNLTPEANGERLPLVSARGDLALVADARVDNRDDLAAALSFEHAHPDVVPTDAQLILAAYEKWGEDCAARILGDFAFAIWDNRRRRVFAARDAMAMRAFCYRLEPRRMLFATEVKQILAAPGVPARIFEPAVGAQLAGTFGSLEWTSYAGIVQLPPGHALLVSEGNHRTWKYWEPDPDARIEYRDEAEYAEHLLDLLKTAVACRLRGTKPAAIFLSGGLDSGSIASVAGWLLRQGGATPRTSLHAYCFTFDTLKQSDERHISDLVARHYGIPVSYIPAEEAWPLKDYPEHGPDRDEPWMGPYQPMVELGLATARADGMGALFVGDHGDHTMGAVFDYLDLLFAGRWRTLWRDLSEHGTLVGLSMAHMIRSRLIGPLRAALWPRGRAERLRRRVRRMLHRPPLYPDWVRPEFAERIRLTDVLQDSTPHFKGSGFARHERYEALFGARELQNTRTLERNYARFALSRTDPWGDRRIAEFALAVPQRVLNRAGEQKRLARRAMTGIMPEDARQQARKIYPTPLYERTIRGRERGTVLNLIKNSRCAAYGYIDERLLREHFERTRPEERHNCFWPALALEMWLRAYWDTGRTAPGT